jgi:hypothetical protein
VSTKGLSHFLYKVGDKGIIGQLEAQIALLNIAYKVVCKSPLIEVAIYLYQIHNLDGLNKLGKI